MFGRLKKKLKDVVKKVSSEDMSVSRETDSHVEEDKIIEKEGEFKDVFGTESIDSDELHKPEVKEKEESSVDDVKEAREELPKEDIDKESSLEVTEQDKETELEELPITEEELKALPKPKKEIKKDDKLGIITDFLKKKKKEAISEKEATVSDQPRKGLFKRFAKKVKEKTLSEDKISKILKELERALLENDVALAVVEEISKNLKEQLTGKEVRRGKTEIVIREALRNAMLSVMQQEPLDIEKFLKDNKSPVVLFLGFNGTGKTTSIAKVAHKLKKNHSVVLAAGDTFRAASIEQLEEHGRRLGVGIIKHKYGSDSAAVIFDARKHAAANNIDVVLADTAGRSHSNVNLMDELKKVCRVNKPELKILVLDSLTGNDIYNQSKLFNDAVGVDAIILTKADVYEKGGAALAASFTIKKPILYLGTGQEYDDLKSFDPEEIVKNLLG